MPIGYLIGVTLVALGTWFALAPLRRPRPLRIASWFIGSALNELPIVALLGLLAATSLAIGEGDVDSPEGWVVVGAAVLTMPGLVVARRDRRRDRRSAA